MKLKMEFNDYFIAVRHGEIEREKDSILGSGSDVSLNKQGFSQAEVLASALSTRLGLEIIISSPLLRARQTAEIIAQRYPRALPIAEIHDIKAQGFGILEGQRVSLIRTNESLQPYLYESIPLEDRYTSAPPGGESLKQLADRAVDFMSRIVKEIKPMGILLVTHQSVLRAIHGRLKGIPPQEWENTITIPYSDCLVISPELDKIFQGSILNNSFKEI